MPNMLRYIKGTFNLSLGYAKGKISVLGGCSNSDYGGDVDDKKKHLGHFLLLGRNSSDMDVTKPDNCGSIIMRNRILI